MRYDPEEPQTVIHDPEHPDMLSYAEPLPFYETKGTRIGAWLWRFKWFKRLYAWAENYNDRDDYE